MKRDFDGDPERMPRTEDLGPLFAWPERPPEDAQQGVFPIRGALEEQWQRWRASDIGEQVVEAFAVRAIAAAHSGVKYLEAKVTWGQLRQKFPAGHLNNSLLAFVVREVVDRYPECRPLFRLRQRRAV